MGVSVVNCGIFRACEPDGAGGVARNASLVITQESASLAWHIDIGDIGSTGAARTAYNALLAAGVNDPTSGDCDDFEDVISTHLGSTAAAKFAAASLARRKYVVQQAKWEYDDGASL